MDNTKNLQELMEISSSIVPNHRLKPTKLSKNANLPKFIRKLLMILESSCQGLNESIVGWNQEENGIWIKDVDAFIERVMPQFFKKSNFFSFARQLNMYNFKKEKGNKAGIVFKNSKFLKNNPELLFQLRRKKKSLSEKKREIEEMEKTRLEEEVKGISETTENMTRKIMELEQKVKYLIGENFIIKNQTEQLKVNLMANSGMPNYTNQSPFMLKQVYPGLQGFPMIPAQIINLVEMKDGNQRMESQYGNHQFIEAVPLGTNLRQLP